MSEQVQLILEAVRSLNDQQRRELREALATIEPSSPSTFTGRQQRVRHIQGKYRDVATSAEAFIERKREETVREYES